MKITMHKMREILHIDKKSNSRITRIALNILILTNTCLVTSLFFIASKAVTALALVITIIGSAILIDRYYK